MNRKIQKECESSTEYMLPDYLGDVKKLISTTARAIPSGQFNSEESCDVSGIVAYEMVYLDSDNKLSAASFSSDYDISFPVDSEAYVDSAVATSLSNFAIRLTGPRKVSAKANVISDICVSEKWEPTVKGSAFLETGEAQTVSKTVKLEAYLFGEGGEREFAEEAISLEGVNADEIEVITSNAYVRIEESIPVNDGVNIKGTLIVTAIVRTPEQSVFAIRREIPFDETVSISGATPEMTPEVDAELSSVTCGVSESENASVISANVIMELKARCAYNEEVSVIKDAYLKNRDTEQKYENLNYKEHLHSFTDDTVVNLKLARAELGLENAKEIFSVNAELKSPSVVLEGSAAKIKTDAMFSGVACEINEDGNSAVIPLKFSHPLEFDVNLGCQTDENARVNVKLCFGGCEWNLDGDNLYLKCFINRTVSLYREMCEKILSSCDVLGDAEYSKNLSRISVYYPEKNETLFDIAKKFHTTARDIAVDNDISAEVSALDGAPELASGFEKLIIR